MTITFELIGGVLRIEVTAGERAESQGYGTSQAVTSFEGAPLRSATGGTWPFGPGVERGACAAKKRESAADRHFL